MALVKPRRLDRSDYAFAEQGLQTHVLDILGSRENEVDLFRPSLADQHKVGFFTLDRCSQTDVTEVVDLKQMTEIIQILLQDVTNLRRDINFAKHVMQADYEKKLQEKALELYCRINDKVTQLERMHEDRVDTVRRAFRQQLADAIARISVLYSKNMENKIQREKSKRASDKDKLGEQYKEMQATIQRSEQVIAMLKMQLSHYQQQQHNNMETESPAPSDRPSNRTPSSYVSSKKDSSKAPHTPPAPHTPHTPAPPTPGIPVMIPVPSPSPVPTQTLQPPSPHPAPRAPPTPRQTPVPQPPPAPVTVVEELSIKSKSPDINPELEDLREEVSGMSRKINKLEKTIDTKEENITGLNQEIAKLKELIENEKAVSEKFKKETEDMKANAAQEQASSKRLAEEMGSGMAKQKEEMKRIMDERMREAREEALLQAQEEANKMKDAEQNKLQILLDQKKRLEEMLLMEKKKNSQKSQHELDTEKFKKNEDRLRDEINRLKGEIEKIHKIWEKKFAILQQSMHALKDESYIRQTLQRQAATLHHASVSYAADTPVGIMASSKNAAAMKKPVIPDIHKKTAGQTPNVQGASADKDYISYTVSAPSGRGTAMMSVDEHQVMSDGEHELPSDIAPLPDPPVRKGRRSRQKQQLKEDLNEEEVDSRPTSQSHVVVVPSQA
ncbi:protein enabled homolog [Mizuhopecten yessoensis]|uniref:protein enabled homolog n=1 Tax=Mizuhopecten yessoensis TaxID=6573 RepID=UPI000B45BC87|nr:protein enabled homolog [Mizuhopecten yessoensis]